MYKETFKVIPFIDKINMNGRKYSKESIKKIQQLFGEAKTLTGFGYPANGEMKMTHLSSEIEITDMYIKDDILFADTNILTENAHRLAMLSKLRPLTIGTVDNDTGEVNVVSLIGLYFVYDDAFCMHEDFEYIDEETFKKTSMRVTKEILSVAKELSKEDTIIIPKNENKVTFLHQCERKIGERDSHSYKVTIEKIPYS